MTGDGIDLDTLVVRVKADTSGFMAGLGDIEREVDGPLAQGIERAGGSIERALTRAAVTGKLGFEDLRRVALGALADIGAHALRTEIGAVQGASGGVLGSLLGAVGSLFGTPGRATGGTVSGGRPYLVGERGPELFVPASAGHLPSRRRPGLSPPEVG